jgi:hypothetical protein
MDSSAEENEAKLSPELRSWLAEVDRRKGDCVALYDDGLVKSGVNGRMDE